MLYKSNQFHGLFFVPVVFNLDPILLHNEMFFLKKKVKILIKKHTLLRLVLDFLIKFCWVEILLSVSRTCSLSNPNSRVGFSCNFFSRYSGLLAPGYTTREDTELKRGKQLFFETYNLNIGKKTLNLAHLVITRRREEQHSGKAYLSCSKYTF